MQSLLTGKVAIVTGAGSRSGIGFATAKTFVEAGARVAMTDLDGDAVRPLAAELGDSVIGHKCDVRDRAGCEALVRAILEHWGRIDILINNAGVVQARKVVDVSDADLDFMLDANLRGTLHMSQAVIPAMAAQGAGAIVCIASIAAQRGGGLVGGPHYAASKGGVLGLVKAMARELGPQGIRVNAINPGVIMTRMNAGAFDEATRRNLLESIPLGRFGAPADVANACLFLASDLAAYMTGTETDVNGGIHIH